MPRAMPGTCHPAGAGTADHFAVEAYVPDEEGIEVWADDEVAAEEEGAGLQESGGGDAAASMTAVGPSLPAPAPLASACPSLVAPPTDMGGFAFSDKVLLLLFLPRIGHGETARLAELPAPSPLARTGFLEKSSWVVSLPSVPPLPLPTSLMPCLDHPIPTGILQCQGQRSPPQPRRHLGSNFML